MPDLKNNKKSANNPQKHNSVTDQPDASPEWRKTGNQQKHYLKKKRPNIALRMATKEIRELPLLLLARKKAFFGARMGVVGTESPS